MTSIRLLLLAGGGLVGAYGAVLLSDNPPVILLRIAVWAGAGVLLHDFVFAPLCAAFGWAGGRLLPASVRVPVGVAGLALVTLGLLAVPVYDTPGRHPDNTTVLDRPYHLGLLWAAGTVVVALLCYLLITRLPVRQHQVVERQRPRHVERQPPAA